jgi:hypothetical protein
LINIFTSRSEKGAHEAILQQIRRWYDVDLFKTPLFQERMVSVIDQAFLGKTNESAFTESVHAFQLAFPHLFVTTADIMSIFDDARNKPKLSGQWYHKMVSGTNN